MKVATVMSVCGHDKYFDCAKLAIKSFFRNHQSKYPLYVFTDNAEKFVDVDNDLRLHYLDFNKHFELANQEYNFRGDMDMKIGDYIRKRPYHGYIHNHIKVAALLPMAQYYFNYVNEYDLILKVDCDAYWVGNVLERLMKMINVLEKYKYDLFLVERKHPIMLRLGNFRPGVGFTLWRRKSKFIDQYIKRFKNEEQQTIWKLMNDPNINYMTLGRPGYHLVYPFAKKPHLIKSNLRPFLPAYIHCGGEDVYEQMLKLEEWYGDKA